MIQFRLGFTINNDYVTITVIFVSYYRVGNWLIVLYGIPVAISRNIKVEFTKLFGVTQFQMFLINSVS